AAPVSVIEADAAILMGLSHSAIAGGPRRPYARAMRPLSYSGYRFPPEIIQHAIWLYLRFTLSFRDVEELLAERGIDVSHETVRRWVAVFGPMIAQRLSTRERLCDKTTGQRARTFRCDDESKRCNASGQRDRLRGSSRHMLRSTTLSTSVAISSRLQRSVGSAPRPSRHGAPLRALLLEVTFTCNQLDRTQQRDKPLISFQDFAVPAK